MWLATAFILALAMSHAHAQETFDNPVHTKRGHADPWVIKHTDGYYYGTCTYGKPCIAIYRSKDLLSLFKTQPAIVWNAPESGWNAQEIWAPELHFINGKFYVYYAANGEAKGHRMGVLECAGPDPVKDKWTDAGRLVSPDADDWAIDGTVLQQNGKLYFIWSGKIPDKKKMQKLFISQMSSPVKLSGKRLEISRPAYEFERQGNHVIKDVNEGPEILQRNGKTFVIYSASFCGTRYYNLGLLVCDDNADPMNLANWKKSKKSVFQEANGLYGPGHCSFTTDAAGQDWIIYHARTGPGDNEGPRYVCMQPFAWTKSGFPDFGKPRKIGIPAPK